MVLAPPAQGSLQAAGGVLPLSVHALIVVRSTVRQYSAEVACLPGSSEKQRSALNVHTLPLFVAAFTALQHSCVMVQMLQSTAAELPELVDVPLTEEAPPVFGDRE